MYSIYLVNTSCLCVYVCECVCAGSVVVNDTVFQYLNPYLPFGGVGHSGMGAYKGESATLT